MKKFWRRCSISALLMAGILDCCVLAQAKAGEIISFCTSDTNVVLYLADPGDPYEIQCQIGRNEAENVESHFIEEETVPVETIFLLDNSLSVTEKYRPFIHTVLSELAANRMNGEVFTVALFSEEITYLVEQSSDYTEVKQAIDGISYNDQETYLTDVLYELLEEINEEEPETLKRILIVSDGVDNKSIGYTKEELYSQIKEKPCPIYTMGCTYNNNNEQLEDMFALSRMTGGEAYFLDEVTDPMTIVNDVAKMNRTLKVTVTPKAQDCDGTTKGISVVVTTADGQTAQDSIEIKMPFGQVETSSEEPGESMPLPEEPDKSSEPEEPEEPDKSSEPEELNLPKEREIPLPMVHALIACAGVVIIALIVAAIIVARKKKKEESRFMPAPPPEEGRMPPQMQQNPQRGRNDRTQVLPRQDGRERTVVIWGRDDNSPTLVLEDKDNPVHRFEVSLDTMVMIGYNDNCQICLNYEETVSGEHCCIYAENGKFYVQNRSRTNGTFLNGKRVVNSAEIYSGCVLGIGRLNMKVEIL